MGQTSLSVWFVCRLCRGSFGQVDAFIEHKKEKHFTQFQNTTSIVFQETEQDPLYTVINSGDHQLADESHEPPIKVEVNNEDPIIPFSYEIIEEPNLDLVAVKSELITYERKVNPNNENDFFDSQPKQNPYVLLKRLTTEEIQEACAPQYHTPFLKCTQKIFGNSLESHNASDADSNISDRHEAANSTEMQPTATVVNVSTEDSDDLQFECKLCSKQLQSEAQLKLHVGICALSHKDRNRFCVTCNRKFSNTSCLKNHRLRIHGTEEEKLSLFKFKCHVCPKQYQKEIGLRFHLESHKKKKETIKVKISQSKPFKCSYPNCGKEFRFNCDLQRHIAIHSQIKPFSCSFPNCNKKFSQRIHLKVHLRIHTGERPFKCTSDNCNKAFKSSTHRSFHHLTAHPNL